MLKNWDILPDVNTLEATKFESCIYHKISQISQKFQMEKIDVYLYFKFQWNSSIKMQYFSYRLAKTEI